MRVHWQSTACRLAPGVAGRMTALKYRADIDGLRAIAVLPVTLFHAGVPGFSGGFVGVDIFFVISGYLITLILIRELAEGSFSLMRFYERRVRRILPALTAVLVFSVCASYFLLPPVQFAEVGRALRAIALIKANHYFSRVQGDYWQQNLLADQPLLHTWSLAVEEQYYVLFPLLLWLVFTLAKRWFGTDRDPRRGILTLIGVLALLSLAASEWLVHNDRPVAFYLLPSRAWELLLGSGLAVLVSRRPPVPRAREWLGGVGLLMVVVAVAGFDSRSPFPGLYALLPCLGSALLIWSGTPAADGSTTWVARCLMVRPLVFIGLISYSLYLWHWPVIILQRSIGWYAHGLPEVPTVVLLLVMLLLAWGSWRYIELPFRRRTHPDSAWSARLATACGVVVLALSHWLGDATISSAQTGKPVAQVLPPIVKQLVADTTNSPGIACEGADNVQQIARNGGGCTVGDAPGDALPAFALIGDSHARMYTEAARAAALDSRVNALVLARSSCIPVLDLSPPTRHLCRDLTAATFDYLVHSPVRKVVLVGYWIDILLDPELSDRLKPALFAALDRLLRADKSVFLMLDVPLLASNELPFRSAVDSVRRRGAEISGPSLSQHYETQRRVMELVDAFPGRDRIVVLDPAPFLCPRGNCLVADEGQTLYRDRHHLTDTASMRLRQIFLDVIAHP